MAAAKRLSQTEIAELITLHRKETNRFLTPRIDHLWKRGLIEIADRHEYPYGYKPSAAGEAALRKARYL